jgi:hypothetical protein
MLHWLKELDRILRGEATQPAALRGGRIELPAAGLSVVAILLGMFYGLCMGTFAVVSGKSWGVAQMFASMIKVPSLFFLTLFVTLPSLYVFNALVGSRLTLASVLRLVIAVLAIMLTLLASFGTIVAFFSFTTETYSFIVLLNVLIFAVSGFLGLGFLLRTLQRLTAVQELEWLNSLGSQSTMSTPPPPVPAAPEPAYDAATGQPMSPPPLAPLTASVSADVRRAGALDRLEESRPSRNVKTVFFFWILIFGLVGAQMSWILRPFIGSGRGFAWFRPRGGNFFESVFQHLSKLLHG